MQGFACLVAFAVAVAVLCPVSYGLPGGLLGGLDGLPVDHLPIDDLPGPHKDLLKAAPTDWATSKLDGEWGPKKVLDGEWGPKKVLDGEWGPKKVLDTVKEGPGSWGHGDDWDSNYPKQTGWQKHGWGGPHGNPHHGGGVVSTY